MKLLIALLAAAVLAAPVHWIPIPPVFRLVPGAAVFAFFFCVFAVLLREPRTYNAIRSMRWKLRLAWFRRRNGGKRDLPYACPCCGLRIRAFSGFPYRKHPKRYNPERYRDADNLVVCPCCFSMPRHRILAAWFQAHFEEIRDRRILYFAPEPSVRLWLKAHRVAFQTADLYQEADLKLDLQDTGLPDDSVQAVICNHVLEHVDDYAGALRELYRILAPGGLLFLSFPVDLRLENVREDPSIVTENARREAFGQNDHRRVFGRNARELLEHYGFRAETIEGNSFPPEIKPVIGPADYDINILFRLQK